MATTPVVVQVSDGLSPVLAILDSLVTGQVAPDAAGYLLTPNASSTWWYDFSITEACVGAYRITLIDGDGVTVGQAFIMLENTSTKQYATDEYAAMITAANTQAIIASQSSYQGTLVGTLGSHTTALTTLATEVGKVIKSGETFTTSSAYETNRNVTFTRV
jgi:hypothetical protein